ncbi:branched-chain amino acid ABC transporter permease [Rhodoferax sp.]|uniref:branched-chain amino acid ABC transporter permease n=1 Tax=Rhodoferax sp. TaxID=50421 RepID=UPI002604C13E|nr:branched-chain amino acid ABC transporter permease [Rhodoferax sp.]
MLLNTSDTKKILLPVDMSLCPTTTSRVTVAALAVVFIGIVPLIGHEYYLSIFNLIFIAIIGAIGLNILVGNTGQVSIGHGAFMSVGAYMGANLIVRLDAPFWLAIPAAGLMAALIGVVVGLPSLRIRGIYLVVSTLAAQLIIEWLINHVPAISGGVATSINVPRPSVFGMTLKTQQNFYYFLVPFVIIAIIAALNIKRTRIGRAFIAIRDQDIAAEIMGINISRYKLIAFLISSFYAGVAGILYTYYLGVANYEQFQINVSIDYLAMIIIGGLGSVRGSILGAVFVTLLPIASRWALEAVANVFSGAGDLASYIPHLRMIVFGFLIIVFIVQEPDGLNKIWLKARSRFRGSDQAA